MIEKHNIYRARFNSSLNFVFSLEDAFDADDFISFLDMKTFEVVNLHAYEVWDDIVDLDEVDTHQLESRVDISVELSSDFDVFDFEKLMTKETDLFLMERYSFLNQMQFRSQEEQLQISVIRREILNRMKKE